MRRLVPLLAIALLPVAAPVPPGERVEFGTGGLLSRDDLDKVAFDTRPARREDGRERADEAEPEEPERDERRVEKPDGPPRPNRYDVAVHLPWAKFRAGDPMPVYLVLRNNRASTLGLRSRIELSGDTPDSQGGGMSFDVRDRATGKSVRVLAMRSTNCGGGSLVDVPPFGFYCVKGDLNRLTGARLEPGEYEVDWNCGPFASAPVRFTVTASDAKPERVARRPHLHFYHLADSTERTQLERADEPVRWNNCQLDSVRYGSMTAALAVGPGGAYVPDVRAIPTADKLVEVWAVWKPYRDADRVSVTLRAVPPHKEVRFEELPQLFLQIETPADADRELWNGPGERKQGDRGHAAFVTPLTIEVRLPEGWHEGLGSSETARVAVLVAAKRIEYPRGAGQRLVKVEELQAERKFGEERPPVWSGVVRSDFTELRVPPRLPLPAPAP